MDAEFQWKNIKFTADIILRGKLRETIAILFCKD